MRTSSTIGRVQYGHIGKFLYKKQQKYHEITVASLSKIPGYQQVVQKYVCCCGNVLKRIENVIESIIYGPRWREKCIPLTRTSKIMNHR